MNIIGIITEYNPFHNGHLYHINKIKEKYPDSLIIAVINGYFTERGTTSILSKESKTKIALENNIDIVIELPFIYEINTMLKSYDLIKENHLTAIMITHNMKDAINYGNRLFMMNDGQLVLDIHEDKKNDLQVSDLLQMFEVATGEEMDNDRMLLG